MKIFIEFCSITYIVHKGFTVKRPLEKNTVRDNKMFTFAPRLRHMIREGDFYRATIGVTLNLFRSLSMLLR